jgi:hypothetical protein
MQIKRVKCHQCNAVLDVKNSKNEEVKQITCPSCQTWLQVRFAPQQEPIEAHTFLETPQSPQSLDNGETQLAAGMSGATQLNISESQTQTHAELLYGGVNYPLVEGRNIVGRKGNTSKATVQIETADRYMSRQHVAIEVTTLPNGTLKVLLSNYQNKNLTSVDGQPIETGDAVRLTDGNAITMGHSTLTFKLS